MRCAVLSVFCVCLFAFGFVVCRSASPHFGGALTADVGRPSSSADLVVPGQPVKASALWDVVLLGVATDVTTVFAAVAHVLFTNDSGVCSVLAFVTSVCLRWVCTFFFFLRGSHPLPTAQQAGAKCTTCCISCGCWKGRGRRGVGEECRGATWCCCTCVQRRRCGGFSGFWRRSLQCGFDAVVGGLHPPETSSVVFHHSF